MRKYRYWNEERCLEEAKKYTSRSEFVIGCAVAYNKSLKNGWIDNYTWFSKSITAKKWDYEACMEESKKYKTRTEFAKGSGSAYQISCKNKWLDNFTWLANPIDINKDEIDTIYAYEFTSLNSVYVGRTLKIRLKDRDREHLYDRKDSVAKFSYDNSIAVPEMKILEQDITVKTGVIREQYWIDEYKRLGWVLINKIKAGSIGSLGARKWTYKKVYQEALKYKRSSDFEKGNPSAYKAAIRNNWRKDYTWIPYAKMWTYEEVYELARQFEYKVDFYRNNCNAYSAAVRNGWLEKFDWFLDGIKRTGEKHRKWNYETCLEESKKYKSRGEFGSKSNQAYRVSIKNGWIDEFFPKTK